MQKHPLVHSFKTPTEETHTWGNPTDQQMQPQPSNVTSTNVWHRRQGKPPTSHPARPRPKQTLPAFSRKIVTVVVGPNRQHVLNLNVWMGRQLASRLKLMIMQLPPAQMANRDGDAGMETMLWDINIIPNELDNGYLMLPPGVLHMSALGRFGRFTLFSPRVSHSKHLPVFCLCCVLGLGVFVALWCFCFLFCKCLESRILRAV